MSIFSWGDGFIWKSTCSVGLCVGSPFFFGQVIFSLLVCDISHDIPKMVANIIPDSVDSQFFGIYEFFNTKPGIRGVFFAPDRGDDEAGCASTFCPVTGGS